MANTGPIQVPSSLSNLKTFPDLVRFLSSFTSQVAGQFNNMLSNKSAWGVVDASANVLSGSDNFGASLISPGEFWIAFREGLSSPASAVATPSIAGFVMTAGTTLSGFNVKTRASIGGAATSIPFSFIATGAK